MDSKILNLFSFLNSNENRYTDSILTSLSTLDDFKQFKNITISKETLDFLICKHGFNPDNKEIVDYLKSLGGSDDFFKDVKQWMDEIFKDLEKFNLKEYPESIFYGNVYSDFLIELKPQLFVDSEIISKFRNEFYKKLSDVKFNESIIFLSYINNILNIKANKLYHY